MATLTGHQVYLGLGSNLGDSITTLRLAVQQLKQHAAISGLTASHLYRSKPIGPQDQPDYWNAVVGFQTTLSPHQVLTLALDLEQQHGRNRVNQLHWGARTLDLDVLLYDQLILNTPDLILPHPYLTQRAFVVCPLLELAPQLMLPQGSLLNEYLIKLQDQLKTLQIAEFRLL